MSNRRLQFIAIGLALASLAVIASAQESRLRFTSFGVEQGLSHNSVSAILKDSRGVMWIGTQEGLNEYDGSEYRVIGNHPDHNPSLTDAWITSLVEHPVGVLWIGSKHGRLQRLNLKTYQLSTPEVNPGCVDLASVPTGVRDFLITDSGRLITGFVHSGLWEVDPGESSICRLPVQADSTVLNALTDVRVLHEGVGGRLWIGTWSHGLFAFDPVDNGGYVFNELASPEIPGGRIRDIVTEQPASIWIATSGAGVLRWNPTSRELTPLEDLTSSGSKLSDNKAWSLYRDPYDVLWIGT